MNYLLMSTFIALTIFLKYFMMGKATKFNSNYVTFNLAFSLQYAENLADTGSFYL